MRNKLLIWLFPLLLLACAGQPRAPVQLAAAGGDSGFGGTGIILYTAGDDEGGSGFGGTGIVGNIDAFGSIWVNGLEIDYDENVRIGSNLPGSAHTLKLGQTVVLETADEASEAGRPLTREIRILYTMAGPIQAVADDRIRVHDQWVMLPEGVFRDENLALRSGAFIAINAHQDDSAGWVASRLSANPAEGIIEPESIKVDFSERVSRLVVDEKFRFIRPHWAKQRLVPMKIQKQFIPAQEWQRMSPVKSMRPDAGVVRPDMRQREDRMRQLPPSRIRRQMQSAPPRPPAR